MKLACIVTPRGPRTVIVRSESAALLLGNENVVQVADHPGPGFAVWNRIWKRMLVQAEPSPVT